MQVQVMSVGPKSPPPRWFVRTAWKVHRAVLSVTGGRIGLRRAKPDRWGMLRLHTIGRSTGQERTAVLGYVDDGSDMILLAMNGWAKPLPAWWLNLEARPETSVDLSGERRDVRSRLASEEERPRLWALWAEFDKDLDAFAAGIPHEVPVVVLEPR
jgi:deazaflavin-dependent oxidoreductase (nitroreductase family)